MPHPVPPAASPSPAISRLAFWAWRIFQIAVLLLPPVLLHRAVRHCRVNTLFLDDWVYVPLYEKAAKGLLTWHDLYAGYLEHRIPIPKLIAILGVLWTKGDVTTQCWAAYVALVGSWLGIGWLLWRTFRDWDRLWLPWALAGGILCSTIHWQNLLWPSNHVLAMPGIFLVLTLLCLGSSKLGFWVRLGLVFIFTWCAMHSCASGLSLVGLIPAVVLCGYGTAAGRERWRFLAFLCGGLAVASFFYLHDLKSEVDPAFAYGQEHGADTLSHDVGALLKNPAHGIPFFIAQLGSNLSRCFNADRRTVPLVIGWALLTVFLALAAWAWRGRKSGRLARCAPFLALGGYALGAAFLITLGRAWASVSFGGALNNRYSSISAMLIAAIAGLAAIWHHELSQRDSPSPARQRLALIFPVGGSLLASLLLVLWCQGRSMMTAWQEARLRGAVDLHFSQVLGLSGQDGRPGQQWNIRLAKERVKTLDDLGFMERPLATDRSLAGFKLKGGLSGSLAKVTDRFITKNKTVLLGHALLKSMGRPPDGIALTARPADPPAAEPQLIALTCSDEQPSWADWHYTKDFHFILSKAARPERFGRWRIELSHTDLPPGRHKLELWALDYKEGTRQRIGDGFWAGQAAE